MKFIFPRYLLVTRIWTVIRGDSLSRASFTYDREAMSGNHVRELYTFVRNHARRTGGTLRSR